MRLLGVVLVVILCAGCQSWRDRQMESRHDRARAAALAKIDQPACQAKGGHIRSVGMFGTPVCVVPFPDGGPAGSQLVAAAQSVPVLFQV